MVDMGQAQPGRGDIIPAGPGNSVVYLLDAKINLCIVMMVRLSVCLSVGPSINVIVYVCT